MADRPARVVILVTAAAAGYAGAVQAAPPDEQAAPTTEQTPAANASTATPGALDGVPDWTVGPATFAVTPLENHVTNGRALDWIIAEAPFEIAEKTQAVLGLDALGAPLYVGGEPVPAEADTVAAFGARAGAKFVITGWYDKIGEDLRITLLAWRVDRAAVVAGEGQRRGPAGAYHALLGGAIADMWTKAGIAVEPAAATRLARTYAKDVYPVFMFGRGLGELGSDDKAAEHDLERAVFLAPTFHEAQRVLGELYLRTAAGDRKRIAKAAGKVSYALDLAPDDVAALATAAGLAADAGKWERAKELAIALVRRRPWDLAARDRLGAALWQLGDPVAAEHQLAQVVAHDPDRLTARRVLALIHASRNDTPRLVHELEAIAARAPADLETQQDLATAYASIGQWAKAQAALAVVSAGRPDDAALVLRTAEAQRRLGELDAALATLARASKLAPTSSAPAFASAQALLDAGRLADARHAYEAALAFASERPYAQLALAAIAVREHDLARAAPLARDAARSLPRSLDARRAVISIELGAGELAAAARWLAPSLAAWPRDAQLHYLAAVLAARGDDRSTALTELGRAMALDPGFAPARTARGAIAASGAIEFAPAIEVVRPWGDAAELAASLDHYDVLAAAMAIVRAEFQGHWLAMLKPLGRGPLAIASRANSPQASEAAAARRCPAETIAPSWRAAQDALARYAELGVELEDTYRFVIRHDELGLTGALLPTHRAAAARLRKRFAVALADLGELRTQWLRGALPELRAAGCDDKALAAGGQLALTDRGPFEDPQPQPQREPRGATGRARATIYVDNTRCREPVDVWIDGELLGRVDSGRRSALPTVAGARSLCLLAPAAAQCGDRGTVRHVYVHDGWTATMHCPK